MSQQQQQNRTVTNKAGTKSVVVPPKPDLSTAAVAQRTGLEKHLPPPKPTGTTKPTVTKAVATTQTGKKQYPPAGAKLSGTTSESRGRGRTSILAGKSKEEIQKEVKVLLDDLRKETDAEEKKAIRRKLRARGHWGGLGGQGAVREAAKAK